MRNIIHNPFPLKKRNTPNKLHGPNGMWKVPTSTVAVNNIGMRFIGIDNFHSRMDGRKFDPSAMKNGWDNAGKTQDIFNKNGNMMGISLDTVL